MVAKKYFDIGDLVWAKMKSFPFWPAKIVKPPADTKSSALKKARHYVFFFGSENYAWILDQNIVQHSEEMLQAASSKKNSNSLKLAIKQITEEAPQKAKLLVKEKESPEVSTSGTKRKTAKVQRMKQKTERPRVRKKVVLKRCIMDENANKRISTVTENDYIEPQLGPIIHLHEPNEAARAKNVRPSNKKIGFIGLGMMGQRLVKNLLTTNHKVTVWNRSLEKCIDFAQAGVVLAESPCDMVRICDIIFCCVSDSKASKNVVFGKHGILSGLERSPHGSKGYVEMTTMDPTTSTEIAEAITHKGGRYLEATINGTLEKAEDRAMLILSVGDRKLFSNCESCFFAFSHNVYHLSCDVGSGSKMKLILSMLIGILQAAFAEAMALVKRCNLNQVNFMEILEHGHLYSRFIEEKGRVLLSGSFPTDNSLEHLQKDLELALSLGTDYKQPMLVTTAANEVFKCANSLLYSDVYAFYSNSS
ncbi:cytokine-like nuclear factor N-PAC [Argiope bruennichi]|uniref:Cytokine-like nuclear factor N-PAC n=1 Tax=Argiope bruennichi TaxID=94029 RepID=A0A8T0F718_ARGBR|nr:cytokine-like nuclear factor N-PAC [Argiope bruennichi]XP_055928312.1 cytokine-like nuclear factor N-PAC [Argiope bruennichi]XP_055928313.1 cytokine-like nuclear factor N-PAC [Argiope bruennichi]KAF8785229.1 putative oxidoreductase GLYR1 like protein [Argiope bruennichi]